MADINSLTALIETLVKIFGPTFTIILFFLYIYFRYLKKDGIQVSILNEPPDDCENHEKKAVVPIRCKLQLLECSTRFSSLDNSSIAHSESIKEMDIKIDNISSNISTLLERTRNMV